jgi:hypothetical protein
VLQSEFPLIYSEKGPWNRPLLILIAVAIAAVIASRQTIVPVETVTWSWSRAGKNALRWGKAAALAGLDYGTALGLVGNVIWLFWTLEITAGTWRGVGTVVGTAGGACAVLFSRSADRVSGFGSHESPEAVGVSWRPSSQQSSGCSSWAGR